MPTKSINRRNIKRSLFINITFFSSTSQSNIPHQFCFTGPYNSPIRQPKHNLNKNNKQQYFKSIKYLSATSSNLISQIKLLPIYILGKVRYSRFREIPSILSGKAIIQVTSTNSKTRALSLRKQAAQMKPSTSTHTSYGQIPVSLSRDWVYKAHKMFLLPAFAINNCPIK